MASKHLKRDRSKTRTSVIAGLSGLAVTAGLSGVLAAHVTDGNATASQQPAATAPVAPQPLSQEGRLVAVSPTSVTAQSPDGFARTYLIDAQTNAITATGSAVGGAATAFAVNDEVAILGVVRDGTAVATAVAGKQVTNLAGPPMDAL